ncbi:MAG: response regulator, partial [Bacteroidota bacterium]
RFRLLITASDYSLSNPAESKRLLEEALLLASEIDFTKGKAEVYCSLTYYYFDRMDYARAVENGLQALRGYELMKDEMGIYESYNVLAGVYTGWRDFTKAREYMQLMEQIVKKNPSLVDEAAFCYTIGFFTLKQDDFKNGGEWIQRALRLYIDRNDQHQIASCYFLLAKSFEGLGSSSEALKSYQRSIDANKKNQHPNAPANTASAHEGIAKLLIGMKRLTTASAHLDTALRAATQIGSVNMLLKIFSDQAQLNETSGNFQKALAFERRYKQLSDSVLNTEKSKALAEAQAKYESEKKEQTIAMLNQQQKFQRQLTYFLTGGIALLTIAAIAIFLLQRSRTRKAKQLLTIEQSLNSQLIEIDKVKSRFFTNISHEFRTPLTLIISPVEEKLVSDGLSQKDKVFFQSIKRSAHRLLALINQVLELSKLESGFMKIHNHPGDLYHFIMPILSSFDSLADVSQVRYSKEVRIPTATVLFDYDKLETIITNLLSNAFKFTPKGEKVDLKLTSAERSDSVELTIEVRNSGTSIPRDQLTRIFDPFYRIEDGAFQGIPGTGLGLSLVKELVKLHGGTVDVVSNEKEGTRFTVSLTYQPAGSTVLPKETRRWSDSEIANNEGHENAAPDDARETILVVEDSQDVRSLLRQGLAEQYNIVEAATGKMGVELAHDMPIDLIISDVMMPVMSGVELCHSLKNDEATSHIPIILLTARADHESKLEGLRTGADDYLTKPFNFQELNARISNLIVQRKKLVSRYNRSVVVKPHEITVTPLDERFIQRAIQFLEEHLDDSSLDVTRMTTALGMSRTNLHRKVKAITGLSTSEFIQDFRLRRAMLLIEQKTDSISQIAYQVGFNDQSYFTKCFKKKFGKTPSEVAAAS